MLSTKGVLSALSELGLNNYEAKTYLSLTTEGISTAKNLSDITGIPYGKVYEIVYTLASKGFVKILPTKPMKCQAVSPRDSIEVLKRDSQQRIDRFGSKVLNELEPLFARHKEFSEPQGIFWIVKGRKNVNKKMEEMICKAQKQICIFTSENGLKRLGFHKELLEAMNKKKVKIIVAGNVSKNNYEEVEGLDFCEVRHVDKTPCHFLSIDQKEAMMVEPTPDDEDFLYGRDLGTLISNESFTHFLESSFLSVFSESRSLQERVKEIQSAKAS